MRLSIAHLALLPLALATPIEVVEKRQLACQTGVYIICAPPHDNDTPGSQQSLIDSVTTAIPGSTSYIVPYDSYTTDYATGINQGEMLMAQQIEDYATSCPNSPIVLMGYSEGGIVMMNTICGGISDSLAPNILGAIAYGEETFVPGLSYDESDCTVGPSEHPRTDTAACDPFAPSIQSYCNAGDERCCSGTDPNGHFEYTQFDSPATSFIVNRFNTLAKRSAVKKMF